MVSMLLHKSQSTVAAWLFDKIHNMMSNSVEGNNNYTSNLILRCVTFTKQQNKMKDIIENHYLSALFVQVNVNSGMAQRSTS